jgi:hypothetical protein
MNCYDQLDKYLYKDILGIVYLYLRKPKFKKTVNENRKKNIGLMNELFNYRYYQNFNFDIRLFFNFNRTLKIRFYNNITYKIFDRYKFIKANHNNLGIILFSSDYNLIDEFYKFHRREEKLFFS